MVSDISVSVRYTLSDIEYLEKGGRKSQSLKSQKLFHTHKFTIKQIIFIFLIPSLHKSS